MLCKVLLLCLLLASIGSLDILTSVDLTQNVQYNSDILYYNFIGLSIPYPQVLKNLTSPLLRGYIKNSYIYNQVSGTWRISIKMQWPKGYLYNCPAYRQKINSTITCVRDIMNNSDIANIGSFLKAVVPYGRTTNIGFDQQSANYKNQDFLNIYDGYNMQVLNYVGPIGGWFPIIQLYDQADLYEANGIRSKFTPSDFNAEIFDSWNNCYFPTNAPGLSINASKEWMDTFYNFSDNQYGTFTVYAQPFANVTNLTIATLLNQSYYKPYLQNRFIGTAGPINPANGNLAITDLRMVSGDGISGVTDGMAAAIWALDFALQCALFGLTYVLFNNDFSATNVQSPLGYMPNFTPSGSYYGMLMMSLVNSQFTNFATFTVNSGTSSNIKIYGLNSYNLVGFVIINKDLNKSASGIIQINMTSDYNITCLYMTASDLSSKDISIAGEYFIPGNSSTQGNFTQFVYTADSTGFKVPLNYSQVAYCTTYAPNFLFVKDTSLYQQQLYLLILLVIILTFTV